MFKFLKFLCSNNNNYQKFIGFKNPAFVNLVTPGVTLVRTPKQAEEVLKILEKYKNRIHSWDTETIDIDVKAESNIKKGSIICA